MIDERMRWAKHLECGQRTGFPALPLLGTEDSEMGRVVTPWRVLGGQVMTGVPDQDWSPEANRQPSVLWVQCLTSSSHQTLAHYNIPVHIFNKDTTQSGATAFYILFGGIRSRLRTTCTSCDYAQYHILTMKYVIQRGKYTGHQNHVKVHVVYIQSLQ